MTVLQLAQFYLLPIVRIELQLSLTFDDSDNAKQITLSSLFQAIANNSSLPLHTLKIDCNYVITSADAKYVSRTIHHERAFFLESVQNGMVYIKWTRLPTSF